MIAKVAEAIASGLTDREAGLLAGIRHDTMTEWRKYPEFSEAMEKATAERLLTRLERIEAGEQGWQGTAWALERIYPHRFARPEVMNQIAVVQAAKTPERVIVLPKQILIALKGREGYCQRTVHSRSTSREFPRRTQRIGPATRAQRPDISGKRRQYWPMTEPSWILPPGVGTRNPPASTR
jgi:hypothetical protein